MENQNNGIKFDLQVSEVDDSFLVQSKVEFEAETTQKLMRKSYIFYVIQLRTGVTPDILKNITNQIIDSCFQLIEQGLNGISFIINGTHHPLKTVNVQQVKELLSTVMVISQNDDYFDTLQKTRHSVQTLAQRLNQTRITLIFFFSYVEIDHTLGVKKRSYIDYLNEHSENCRDEVQKLSKTIRTYTDECKTYIISLDKNGEEEEDYSLADTDLMNQINSYVGNYGSIIYRNYSNNKLTQSFKTVTSLLMSELYSFSFIIPIIPNEETKLDFRKYSIYFTSFKENTIVLNEFFHKTLLDLKKLMAGGAYICDAKRLEEKLGEIQCIGKMKFKQLEPRQMITARVQLYIKELRNISWKLTQEIVSYKRKYELGKSFLVMNINQPLLLSMRERIDSIYEISKQIYTQIFSSTHGNKHQLFEFYSELKGNIDAIQEVLLGVFKKRIGGSQIGKLSQLINLGSIKRALKVKLIRRINANPYLLDQVYRTIEEIVDGHTINFQDLEMNSQKLRSDLGNCILSDYNFVKAMKEYDAMGIAFQIQRPQSAIADPGRIRIRQVSPFLMRTSQFFQKFIYKINYTPELVKVTLGKCLVCGKYNCYLIKHNHLTIRAIEDSQVLKYKKEVVKLQEVKWNQDISSNSLHEPLTHEERIVSDVNFTLREVDYLRDVGQLQKTNYTERCDYTDRANRTPTVLGFMPLYLSKEHWLVSKQLMKPSLAWTATGEPLGYLFSQFQIIPFMVLSNLIRTTRQKQYQLQQEMKNVALCKNEKQLNELETKVNLMKQRLQRMNNILKATEQTCKQILLELSTQKYDPKLLELILKQYTQYERPINRTVDIIPNNSAFIGQLFTAFNNQLLPKPKQADFHQFFIRLVEEQLRRETDGWNEQETQDMFIDKLLNVEAREISKWNFSVIGGEEYLQKFKAALQGLQVQRNYIQLKREQLQMMLKKEGKFNDSQRLLLIEYKRLYENRVLWLWYVRFLLYGTVERVKIHKWKCLDLKNSYQLFTMIIQNKKQRKNYKRREAIIANEYADPFDYVQAREFLEKEFIELRSKRESQVLKDQNIKVCIRAAEIFCMTGNLEQAAGTLLYFNQNGLFSYFNELMRGKCVRLGDKLRMLLTGQHRGIRLFGGWKMGKKKCNKLRMVYPVEFLRYQYMF